MNYNDYKEKALNHYLNVEKKSENTVNTLRKQLNVFGGWLEATDMKVEEIAFSHLSDYIATQGGKASTINARINALRKLFDYMEAMEYINTNPSSKLKNVKVKTSLNDEGKVLTEAQMLSLLNIVKHNATGSKSPKRDYAIISLALDMGLRRSEYTWLKLKDFDLTSERKSFKVLRKGGMVQKLPLHDNVAEAIKDYVENERGESEHDELFLTTRTRKPFDPDSMGQMVGNLISFLDLGKEYNHIHICRHSAITSMLRRGMPVTTVQFVANHKSVNQTLAYTHLSQEDYNNDFFNFGGFTK